MQQRHPQLPTARGLAALVEEYIRTQLGTWHERSATSVSEEGLSLLFTAEFRPANERTGVCAKWSLDNSVAVRRLAPLQITNVWCEATSTGCLRVFVEIYEEPVNLPKDDVFCSGAEGAPRRSNGHLSKFWAALIGKDDAAAPEDQSDTDGHDKKRHRK